MSEQETASRLLEKSKEAFALAVELYNRPTLKFHAETCSIILCNAWELMLKAHLVQTQGIDSIYYTDNPDRTLSLNACLKKVFTNDKSPLRLNMDALIDFRNINTHFITDEYEIVFGPFLQVAVTNFADQLLELHGIDITDVIPENHLALTVKRGDIDPETIRAKYEPKVAQRLLKAHQNAMELVGPDRNPKIAVIYETSFRITKNPDEADFAVRVDKSSDTPVAIVREIKNSSEHFPYTARGVVDEVNRLLKKKKINVVYPNAERESFSLYDFGLFVKAFGMKQNPDFAWDRKASNEKASNFIYSQRVIESIIGELTRDPQKCLCHLKEKVKQQ